MNKPALALLLAFSCAASALGQGPVRPSLTQRVVEQGIAVDFEIRPLDGSSRLIEGEDVAIRFRVSDTTSGTPLSGVFPAAWMDLLVARLEEEMRPCEKKIADFVGGSIFAQAELDLNVYYALALNHDATISVVDPLFGFGSTKLLAMVFLESPGEDWVLTGDDRWVFVSLPEAGKVAVVDTASWEVVGHLEPGARPRRVALQPDEAYLWVTVAEDVPKASGVAVFDWKNRLLVAKLATGAGPHEIAFSADSRHAFLTNRDAGTVSAVSVRDLAVTSTIATGPRPVSLDTSGLAGSVYVSHEGDGTVAVIDQATHEVTARVESKPGLGALRFAPGGRYAFVLNPAEDRVEVLDAATNRIVQGGHVEPGPEEIAFSDELAYIRSAGSEIVLMVPLAAVGAEGSPLSVIDFTGGQRPFGKGSRPSSAPKLVQAPGADAVLVANPGDGAIYYYQEGMAAPMGSFQNYNREPRAVEVVDRSLREVEPGVYQTVAKLRRPGDYDVAFFLDAPRMTHCFDLRVEPDPGQAAARAAAAGARVEYQVEAPRAVVGEPLPVRLKLLDSTTGEPLAARGDVIVLSYQPPGRRQQRQRARPVAGGLYELEFTAPDPGLYYLFTECASCGLPFGRSPRLVLEAIR